MINPKKWPNKYKKLVFETSILVLVEILLKTCC
jgi:hypothetical protein